MKALKYVSVIIFFLVIIGLSIGGYFLLKNVSQEPFTYKEVEEVVYGDLDINDFLNQKVTCKQSGCSYRKKDLKYSFNEITKLGDQKLTLELEYNGSKYNQDFSVNVVDKTNPTINLKEKVIILKKNSKFNPKDYIETVKDDFDSLNAENIVIENNVDLKKTGEYEVLYKLEDASKNIGTAKLKVIIRDEVKIGNSASIKKEDLINTEIKPPKTEVPNSILTDPSKNPTSNPESKEFLWTLTLSGATEMSNTFSADQPTHTDTKNINYSFASETIHFDFGFASESNYTIDVSIVDLSGKTIKEFKDNTTDTNGYFDLKLSNLESVVVTIKVKDNNLNKEYVETLNLNIKYPEELTDIRVTHEQSGNIEEFYVEVLGGVEEELALGAFLIDTNDPKMYEDSDDYLIIEDGIVKLKYEKGCFYELIIAVSDGDKLISKTIKIEK